MDQYFLTLFSHKNLVNGQQMQLHLNVAMEHMLLFPERIYRRY